MVITWPLKEFQMSKKSCLKDIINKNKKYILGLNSGTSSDGIDAAIIQVIGSCFGSRFKFIAGKTYGFSAVFKKRLKKMAELKFNSGRQWLELDIELAELFAASASKIVRYSGLKPTDIDLIGSHGHTIRHLPCTQYGAITHQIGDPARIAVKTGITTVGDFRVADTAAGGQGAPLTPIVNAILFGRKKTNITVLNIGGIANLSVLKSKAGAFDVCGCDTGPGNMLVDYISHNLFNRDYDEGGRLALAGQINDSIIRSILALKFFNRTGPKSAGREDFGEDFSKEFLVRCRKHKLNKHDTMATAAMLTVKAVVKCAELNKFKFDELILTGGGARNRFFRSALKQKLPDVKIALASDYGYPEDYLEAISFAVLANEALCSNRYLLTKITGAKRAVVLGKICQA
jgi:anhydro-N-acetylmuramic acid kinase